jgi:hypothetical protein
MLVLEMRNTDNKQVVAIWREPYGFVRSAEPSQIERSFACQLATSAWLLQLRDEDARKALSDYVTARFRDRLSRSCLRVSLEREYRLCRERLDLCS